MKRLKSMMEELVEKNPEILGAILSTSEGLPIIHVGRLDADAMAAAIASLSSLAVRSTKLVNIGFPDEMIISSEDGKIFVYRLGEFATFGVITVRDITTGVILMSIRKILPVMKEVVESEMKIMEEDYEGL